MSGCRRCKSLSFHSARVVNKGTHKRPPASGPSTKDGRQHYRCCSTPPFGWMSWHFCHSEATPGCSCVNPRPSLTTQKPQKRSSCRVIAALSPCCPLRVVEHVWKCDDVLNTQQSFCDPDVWGHHRSNRGVNDLTTGCTFLLMETQRSNMIYCFCIRNAAWRR